MHKLYIAQAEELARYYKHVGATAWAISDAGRAYTRRLCEFMEALINSKCSKK